MICCSRRKIPWINVINSTNEQHLSINAGGTNAVYAILSILNLKEEVQNL